MAFLACVNAKRNKAKFDGKALGHQMTAEIETQCRDIKALI